MHKSSNECILFFWSWKIHKQNWLATKGFGIKNILNWNFFQNYPMCFLFLRDFFHISKDRHWSVNRSHHSTSRPLSSPYPYLFYNKISFHLSIERWYPLIGEVKHLGYSSHCAYLPCSAIYLLSYTYACVPCWMRATRKKINILKPFWVNHEQLAPNIPYTVFKMCNWVTSASISHVALFRSLVNEQSPMWLLMHVNAYVWLTLKFAGHELSRELSSTMWVFAEFANESKSERGPRSCADECQGTSARGFLATSSISVSPQPR